MSLKILLLFLLYSETSTAFDQCSVPCTQGKPLACSNPSCKAQDNSCSIKSDDQRSFHQNMIDKHNELRNEIALGKVQGFPKAANMYELAYDDELQNLATCNVAQCKFAHDKCRATSKFPQVGQNIYKGPLLEAEDSRRAVQKWYDEIKAFKGSGQTIENFKMTPSTGHFTQVLWALSTHIGCARSKAEGGSSLLACDYGPAGNVRRESMYKKGVPCSGCKNGCSKKWQGLCKNPDPEDGKKIDVESRGKEEDVNKGKETAAEGGKAKSKANPAFISWFLLAVLGAMYLVL